MDSAEVSPSMMQQQQQRHSRLGWKKESHDENNHLGNGHTMMMVAPTATATMTNIGTTATMASTGEEASDASKLCQSLSASLYELLSQSNSAPPLVVDNVTHDHDPPNHDEDASSNCNPKDVYHQFLNSPSKHQQQQQQQQQHHPNNNNNQLLQREKRSLWTREAMLAAGVGGGGSTIGAGSGNTSGAIGNALQFWNKHGIQSEEEFCNGRYLVWLAKEILFGLDMDGGGTGTGTLNNEHEHDGHGSTQDGLDSNQVLHFLNQWHEAIVTLVDNDGGMSGKSKMSSNDHVNINSYYNDNNQEEEEEVGNSNSNDDNDALVDSRVMWQLLLQNANLSPKSLRHFYLQYKHSNNHNHRHHVNEEDEEEDEALLTFANYFQWPSLLRNAVMQSTASGVDVDATVERGDGGMNKRQKINNATHWKVNHHSTSTTATTTTSSMMHVLHPPMDDLGVAWWPLLGYTITHAFLSVSSTSPPSATTITTTITTTTTTTTTTNDLNDNNVYGNDNATIRHRLDYLTSNLTTSLPSIMGIPFFDQTKKHALLAGVAACVLDGLGEAVVRGTMSLNDDGNGNGEEEKYKGDFAEGEGLCSVLGADVGQIVDLLLIQGILPALAKAVDSTIPNLVAESADTLLTYSEVHHRLQNPTSTEVEDDLSQQLIAEDGKKVVLFIQKGNPQLGVELTSRKFTTDDAIMSSLETNSDLQILHPMVVDIRARLMSGNIRQVSKICRVLEDCSGISTPTKKQCWVLLLDEMQEEGLLLEDGSRKGSSASSVTATMKNGVHHHPPNPHVNLSQLTVGPIGRDVVLDYLHNIVLEAKDALFPDSSSSLTTDYHCDEQTKQELLCVKDAVRRATLKFLLPRAFSPSEAMSFANRISEACNPPQLEDTIWDKGRGAHGTAVEVACRILSSPSLYQIWEERLLQEEENEHEHEEESNGVYSEVAEEEDVEEDAPVDMSIDEIHTPMSRRTPRKQIRAEDDEFCSFSPQEELVIEDDDAGDDVVEVLEDSEEEEDNDVKEKPAVGPIFDDNNDLRKEEMDELEEATEPVNEADDIRADINEDDNIYDDHEEDGQDQEDIEDVDSYDDESGTESVESAHGQAEEELDEYYSEEDGVHPHQHFPGNYSGSDDYEEEDNEEDERHAAFRGEYEDEDDSDDVVEILDSSEEEEEVEGHKIDDTMGDKESSWEEEEDNTNALNEAVDVYIAEHEPLEEVEEDNSEGKEEEEPCHDDKEKFALGGFENDNLNLLKDAEEPVEVASVGSEVEPAGEKEGESATCDKKSGVISDILDQKSNKPEGESVPSNANPMDNKTEDVVEGTLANISGKDESNSKNDEEMVVVKNIDTYSIPDSANVQESGIEGMGGHLLPSEEHIAHIVVDAENLAEESANIEETVEGVVDQKSSDDKHAQIEVDGDAAMSEVEKEVDMTTGQAISKTVQDENANTSKEEPSGSKKDVENTVGKKVDHDATPYSSDGGNPDTDDMNMADDEHESIDTEEDKRSLAEGSQQGGTFDEDEGEPPSSFEASHTVDTPNNGDEHIDKPSVLVAAAMSSQRQGSHFLQSSTPNRPFEFNSQRYKRLMGEPGDNQSFDDTSAALASVDANLSEYNDDTSQSAEVVESNVRVIARHHGHDLALGSVLDVHADVVDSGEESSPEDKTSEAGHGQMTDDGYVPDAEATEEEKTERRKEDRKRAIDDGYVPDAEATEEDQPKSCKKEKGVGPVIDEGYIPDGGHTTGGEEASEVEQGDDSNKRNTRDVRFEAVLETKITDAAVSVEAHLVETIPVEPATSQSIDEGYIPDDALTEEEKVERGNLTKNRPIKGMSTQSIDEGYIPDGGMTEEERGGREKRRRRGTDEGYIPDGGHTTPGDATEEDQGGAGKRRVAQKIQRHPANEGSAETDNLSQNRPVDTRLDDLIDEGYIPSAVEGTEEERSEEEDTTVHANSNSIASLDAHGGGKADASVLVATALSSQQRGTVNAALPVNDVVANASQSAFSSDKKSEMPAYDETSVAIAPNVPHLSEHVKQEIDASANAKGVRENPTVDLPSMKKPTNDDGPSNDVLDSMVTVEEMSTHEQHKDEDVVATSGKDGTVEDTCANDTNDVSMVASGEQESKEGDQSVPVEPVINPLDLLAEQSLRQSSRSVPDKPEKSPTEKQDLTRDNESQDVHEKTEVNIDTYYDTDTSLHRTREKAEVNENASETTSNKRSKREQPKLEDSAQPDPPIRGTIKPSPVAQKGDQEDESSTAKYETSKLRRSSRKRSNSTSSSPGVPASIVTRGKGRKRPALPAVPEGGTVDATNVQDKKIAEEEKDEDLKSNDDDSSIASSVGSKDDDSLSIASRSRQKQSLKISSPDKASNDGTEQNASKRPKRTAKAASKEDVDGKESASIASKRSRSVRSKTKEEDADGEENVQKNARSQESSKEDAGGKENLSVASAKGKRGRPKKLEEEDTDDKEPANANVEENTSKRPKRATKASPKDEDGKESISASVSVAPTKGRVGRPRKKKEDDITSTASTRASRGIRTAKASIKETPTREEAEEDDGSVSVASTTVRRSARAKKTKKEAGEEGGPVSEAPKAVRRSARATKKKEAPEEDNDDDGSVSVTSTARARRSTRGTKKTANTHDLRSSDLETRSHHHYHHE